MKGQQAKTQVSWVNPVTRPVDPGHRAVLKVWTYTLDKWLHFEIYLSPHHSPGIFFSDFWSGASFERNNFLNVFIFWVSLLRSDLPWVKAEYEFASLQLGWPALKLPVAPDLIINSIHIEWRANNPKHRSVGSTQWPDQSTLVTGRY